MELEENKKKELGLPMALMAGGVANVFFIISLVLTWKYWRQVKWYIVTMAVANWLELGFRFGLELGWLHTKSWEGGSVFSCKFLMMMNVLGPSLANMAVAALALHTLLTVLTGSQGKKLRHAFVLGMFVLLSLPLPLTRIPMFSLWPILFHKDDSVQCVSFPFFETGQQWEYYTIGYCIAIVYFPLFVVLCCGLVTAVLVSTGRGGNVKGDEHSSDMIITGLLGAVVLIFCVPIYTFDLASLQESFNRYWHWKVYDGLTYLEHCRNIFSALVTAGFAYLCVYCKRGETYLTPVAPNAATSCERQTLVN